MHIMLLLSDARQAEAIVRWLKMFSPPRSARLSLLHVIEPLDVPDEFAMKTSLQRSQRARAREFLDRVARALQNHYLEIREVLLEGFPVYQILKAVREQPPDVIVSGTRGPHRSRGLALGSVSQRLLSYAPCSVALVPSKVRSSRRFKVLLATDGSRGAKEAARFLTFLPHLRDLSVVTTMRPMDAREMFLNGGSSNGGSRTMRAEVTQMRRAMAQKALDDTLQVLRLSGLTPKSKIVVGHPPEAIAKIAQKERCDLLVVGSRGLTGAMAMALGSVSWAVAQSAPCPVLVVRRRAERKPALERLP